MEGRLRERSLEGRPRERPKGERPEKRSKEARKRLEKSLKGFLSSSALLQPVVATAALILVSKEELKEESKEEVE